MFRQAQYAVSRKLPSTRVILLKALPRAGRTELLRALAATMGGLDRIMNCSELLYSKPEVASDLVERAVFVDGVHEGQVDELVTFIRSCLACS